MYYAAAVFGLIPFYLLGAFPTGRLLARSRGVDLEKAGSGNVGATNVARVLGKKAGLITLLVDILKGLLGAAVAGWLFADSWFAALAGIAVVCGHCFSIPAIMKGGKGVATALGVLMYLSAYSALSAVLIFALVFWRYRIVSLASVSAALTAPVIGLLLNNPASTEFGLAAVGLLVVFRHRENLERLVLGTEKKFSLSKSSP